MSDLELAGSALPVGENPSTQNILKRYGLLFPDEVNQILARERRSQYLVEGFIASRSISVLIGDSGLGKSPLAYQLGLCVAAGIPFLDLTVQKGLVVYADFENGIHSGRELRDSLVGFLGLDAPPVDFLTWYPETSAPFDLQGVCHDLRPKLLVVDSLRAFNPSFEQTERAGEGMKSLREAAYTNGVSIFVIHHVKKPGPLGSPSLETTDLMCWLNEAAGHRSLINQSDTRVAAAAHHNEDAAMMLRWHRRLRGESGPIFLSRILSGEGEPIGYRPLEGPELLSNDAQKSAFNALPREFSFTEAKRTYGRSDDPTRKWLMKCRAVGIVDQVSRGRYRKTWPKDRQARVIREVSSEAVVAANWKEPESPVGAALKQ